MARKRLKKGIKRFLMAFGSLLGIYILIVGGTQVYAAATNQSIKQVNGKIELSYKTFTYNLTKHTGTLYVNNALYGYVDGERQIGWETIEGSRYYFQKTGKNRFRALTGLQTINNKTYYFSQQKNTIGQMQTGFVTINDDTYYFYPSGEEQGTMATGKCVIDGDHYLFSQTTGVMKTGWVTEGSHSYYYEKNGRMAVSTRKVGDQTYDFGSDGAIENNMKAMDSKAQSYSSDTKYLILITRDHHRLAIYEGKKDNWTRIHYFKCGTGKKNSPTKSGSFRIGTNGGKFKLVHFNSHGVRCFYATRITGHYMMHSITYVETAPSPSKKYIHNSKIGGPVSNGCVRLATDNAYWIYKNIPRYTRCVIY